MIKTCVICGKHFSLRQHCSRQQTCSEQCRKELKRRRDRRCYYRDVERKRAYWRNYYHAHKWKITPSAKCYHCGKPFKQRHRNHWFCSDDCIVDWFSRHVDRLATLIRDARNLSPKG